MTTNLPCMSRNHSNENDFSIHLNSLSLRLISVYFPNNVILHIHYWMVTVSITCRGLWKVTICSIILLGLKIDSLQRCCVGECHIAKGSQPPSIRVMLDIVTSSPFANPFPWKITICTLKPLQNLAISMFVSFCLARCFSNLFESKHFSHGTHYTMRHQSERQRFNI